MSWQGITLADHFCPLSGEFWRVVESQQQVATVAITDSLSEQAILEQLLEDEVKPPLPKGKLHYLFSTPFRYPPLKNGSRFGTRSENSLFYAAKSPETALAETAYYRLVFLNAISEPPESVLSSSHTLFSGKHKTDKGLKLFEPPFSEHEQLLTHASDYQVCQALGALMRDAGVAAFEYYSARDKRRETAEQGINIALYYPEVIACAKPLEQQEWLCQTTADGVTFKCLTGPSLKSFTLKQFLVNGQLPMPA